MRWRAKVALIPAQRSWTLAAPVARMRSQVMSRPSSAVSSSVGGRSPTPLSSGSRLFQRTRPSAVGSESCDHARFGERVEVGAGGEAAVGGLGRAVRGEEEGAVGRRLGQLEGEQVAGDGRLARLRGHGVDLGRRGETERQGAVGERFANLLPRVGGACERVGGTAEQRDPKRAVDGVGEVDRSLVGVEGDRLIIGQAAGQDAVVAGVEQRIIAFHRIGRLGGALGEQAGLDREHVEALGSPEGHLAGAQLEVGRKGARLERAALVGEGDEALRCRVAVLSGTPSSWRNLARLRSGIWFAR